MSYATTKSGLVYPAEGMDGAAVRAALKEYDRNLDLTQQIDPDWERWVFKVTYAVAPGREEVLFAWREARTGEPLPLSSALVDKVKQLDRNTRAKAPNADELNSELREQQQRDWQETIEDSSEDWLQTHRSRPLLPRTRNWGNKRWKDEEFRRQQARRRKGLDY